MRNSVLVVFIGIASLLFACTSSPGPQGPPPSEETLMVLIDQAISERITELRGPQGPVGTNGPQGQRGPTGYIGPQGNKGPQGFPGVSGPPGPMPSENQLVAVVEKVIDEKQDQLRGFAGPQGIQGAQGVPGPPGPAGAAGPVGPKGDPLVVVSRTEVSPADIILVGTWRVGIDIQPGLYWTEGPQSRSSCYWARLNGFDGQTSEIIANENVPGPSYVRLKPSDAGFETRCLWVRVED